MSSSYEITFDWKVGKKEYRAQVFFVYALESNETPEGVEKVLHTDFGTLEHEKEFLENRIGVPKGIEITVRDVKLMKDVPTYFSAMMPMGVKSQTNALSPFVKCVKYTLRILAVCVIFTSLLPLMVQVSTFTSFSSELITLKNPGLYTFALGTSIVPSTRVISQQHLITTLVVPSGLFIASSSYCIIHTFGLEIQGLFYHIVSMNLLQNETFCHTYNPYSG